ncbi:HAMP domain-containing sensor histidine kinase [Actinomyces israelii]|uniref:histidine kinase n=1 Tax=Actinomyces israelii TaxID=1659 RepID=A0ABT4I7T0_9ACTO|nr:HAMP domain-containing sensor histidine kinase [Actinomyces israelii]MCZ0857804.1 HAMP domain-containing sensor histidine kinase [Actinomyces israelii]WKR23060.1 Adaptive-response sensory-kinase SasA [Actinomyces israelii]
MSSQRSSGDPAVETARTASSASGPTTTASALSASPPSGQSARRPRARRLTIRARLTLTYAGLVTGSGAVLIALVYLYMRRFEVPVSEAPVVGTNESDGSIYLRVTLLSEFLNTMLGISLGALVLLALLSGAVGWVVAGRMLAPLSTMNEAAKQAASGDLSRRLALAGPHDEIRDLADTYDHMLDSLESSLATYRRFAANASHELRTPLATAQTMIDVTLVDPGASADQLRSLVERLRETNQANVETVDALLDLAEAQSGDIYREEVDLGEVVATVLAQLAPEAAEREVTLPAAPGDIVVVEGDPVLLRQAVSNLLRNAVRHNVAGGGVELGLARAGDRARLLLSNDGPLVPAEHLTALREPFVRGAGRGRTRGDGHGLGLAIVSAVAAAHDGVLELSANPSGGLSVVLDLPARSGEPEGGAL